jgi:chromosome segregation ATPase
MALLLHVLLLPFLFLSRSSAHSSDDTIQRILDLLVTMQGKVTRKGSREDAIWAQSDAYCKQTQATLTKSIEDAKARIPELKAVIAQLTTQQAEADSNKAQVMKDISDAKVALTTAQELRVNEAKAYEALLKKNQDTLASLQQGLKAVEQNRTGLFLQTKAATVLRNLIDSSELRPHDRDVLSTVFISDDLTNADTLTADPAVVPVLQTIKESVLQDIEAARLHEQEAIATYNAMTKAKDAQISALAAQLQVKYTRLGELGSDIVNLQTDLDALMKRQDDDSAFLQDLQQSCAKKEKESSSRSTLRQQELETIAKANAALHDILESDLSVKIADSTQQISFLQVTDDASDEFEGRLQKDADEIEASSSVTETPSDEERLALLAYAVRSKLVNLTAVTPMVDQMVSVLKQAEQMDKQKMIQCKAGLNQSNVSLQDQRQKSQDVVALLAEHEDKIMSAKREIESIQSAIKDLDERVNETRNIRQAENQESVNQLSENEQTLRLLALAKERLRRYFDVKRAAIAGLTQLNERRRASAAAVAVASEHLRLAREKETVLEVAPQFLQAEAQNHRLRRHLRSSSLSFEDESLHKDTGFSFDKDEKTILQALSDLADNFQIEAKEIADDEDITQKLYEKATKDAGDLRTSQVAFLAEKQNVVAAMEARGQDLKRQLSDDNQESNAALTYLKVVQDDCNSFMSSYKARGTARAAQLQALQQAKATIGA